MIVWQDSMIKLINIPRIFAGWPLKENDDLPCFHAFVFLGVYLPWLLMFHDIVDFVMVYRHYD